MSKIIKPCHRCGGFAGRRHTPFCTYLGARRRVVDVAMHEKGMILTYKNGGRALLTTDGSWVNLAYYDLEEKP